MIRIHGGVNMDVSTLDKKIVRHNFIEYLKTQYNYARPEIMASNVFYAYNNSIGIDFWSIFESEASMTNGKILLEQKFVAVGRKDPHGHTNVHYGCWVKFKEFLDKKYGGVANLH